MANNGLEHLGDLRHDWTLDQVRALFTNLGIRPEALREATAVVAAAP